MQDTAPKPAKANKARFVLALALIGVGGWLGYHVWHGRHFVETDNAQIEGHLIPIAARVSGYVREVGFSDNQPIQGGAVLVKIDDRDYSARLAQAEADLAIARAAAGERGNTGQAEAQLSYTQAAASAASAGVAQAEANAERARNDLGRTRMLAAKGMATQAQLDAAETGARAADSQLKSARDTALAASRQIGVSSAGLKSAQAKVESVRAQRDLAAIQLADTQIKAPSGGIVSKKSVEVGQLVQAGQPLLTVVPLDEVWVVANLKETDIGRVKVGMSTDIQVDAYPGLHFSGRIESFSPATGAKFTLLPPDNASGNFTKVVQRLPVKIKLDRFDAQATPLRPGMSVEASIRVG